MIQIAAGIYGDTRGLVLGAGGRPVVAAAVNPSPATVVITPFDILRIGFTNVGNEYSCRRSPGDAYGSQLGAGGGAVCPARLPSAPFPATVTMTPFETLRIRLLTVGDVQVACRVHRHSLGLPDRARSGAVVAG